MMTLLRAVTHRQRGGMTLDDNWCCSSECLEQLVRSKIGDLRLSQRKPAKARSARVPLGLLLLSRGILTAEQLKLALAHQRLTEVDFGAAVLHLGYATQEQVTAAVAAQWACPVFPLGDQPLDVQMRIPQLLLDQYGMLPVHYSEYERRLLVGFVRGVQHQALYAIEHITSCTVMPCFITAREYDLHLNDSVKTFRRDSELVFDQPVEAAEMARVTRNYMTQLAAERVRLGKCRDFFWVRIWGRKLELDLLFRVRND
jgi:hypothetical protein